MTDKAFVPEEVSEDKIAILFAVALYEAVNQMTADELREFIRSLEETLLEKDGGAYSGA